ncbi:MAG: GNAT family N-acetyltransferase [Pseudomonadota bacterium]
MSEAIRIRSANRDDLEHLRAIELAAATLFPADRLPDPNATCPEDTLRRALSAGLVFVAVSAWRVCGFAVCEHADGYLHLHEVSVHSSHGKRGIGKELVLRVIEEARGGSFASVTLTTFSDFAWNAPFYQNSVSNREPRAACRNTYASNSTAKSSWE